MRPAHFAREIKVLDSNTKRAQGFNEARAFCAGNTMRLKKLFSRRHRFNEARAFCAGNRHLVQGD